MYVCMHVCMHVCMYVRMYVCMYACMYACMYVYLYCGTVSKTLSIICKRLYARIYVFIGACMDRQSVPQVYKPMCMSIAIAYIFIGSMYGQTECTDSPLAIECLHMYVCIEMQLNFFMCVCTKCS
jgi:hypothetical protein